MKKIIFISALLMSFVFCSGQTFPINQGQGSATTLLTNNGGFRSTVGFINTVYADTTAANINAFIKNYPGAQIRTLSPTNTLWFRNANASAWVVVGQRFGLEDNLGATNRLFNAGGNNFVFTNGNWGFRSTNPTQTLSIGHTNGTEVGVLYTSDGTVLRLETRAGATMQLSAGASISIVPAAASSGQIVLNGSIPNYINQAWITNGGGFLAQQGIGVYDALNDEGEFYLKAFNYYNPSTLDSIYNYLTLYDKIKLINIPNDDTTSKIITIDGAHNVRYRNASTFAGGGGAGAVYAGYGLVNNNDSTLAFRSSLRDSIIALSVPIGRAITINGTTQDLSANRTWNVGTVTSIGLIAGTTGTDVGITGTPVTGSGSITINIPTASASNRGALSSTDWTTFNNKMSNPMTTLGDIIYENATPTPARLAGNTTSVKKGLTQTGNGTISATPAWDTLAIVDHSIDGAGYDVKSSGDGIHYYTTPPTAGANAAVRMQFRPAYQANAPPAGDSILVCDTFNTRGLILYRDGMLQFYGDSLYGYTVSNDTLYVHPAWVAGERVTIFIYDNEVDTVSVCAPPPPPLSWVDLTFTTNTNLVNTSQVFTGTGGTWGSFGLDALNLPGDGAIRARYQASDGFDYIIAFNNTNSNESYVPGNYRYGFYIGSGGLLYKTENSSSSSTGVTLAVGDYAQVVRSGSTFLLQYSTTGAPGTWTTAGTYGATSSATFYVNLNIYTTGSGKCYHPEGYGLFYILPLFAIPIYKRRKERQAA